MAASTQFVEAETANKASELTNAPAKAVEGGAKDLPISPGLSMQAAPAETAAALVKRGPDGAAQGVARVQNAFGNGYAAEVVARLRERRNGEKTETAEPADKSEPVRGAPPPPVVAKASPAVTPAVTPVKPAETAPKLEAPKPATPSPGAPAPTAKSALAPTKVATPQGVLAAPAPVPPKPESASPMETQGVEPAAGTTPAGTDQKAAAGPASGGITESGGAAPPAAAGAAEAPKKAGEPPAAAKGPDAGGPATGPGPAAGNEPAPAQKAPSSSQDDPAFVAVIARTKAVAQREGHNNPAQRKAMEAQAAAPGPANDVASQAAAAQVGKMASQKPNPFDKASFKTALMDKIKAITPKTLEEADEFKKKGQASSIKGDVVAQVDGGKQKAQGGIESTTKEPPDPSAAQPKEVVPLPPTEAGAPPAGVGAQAAAPKPKTPEEVSLQAGSQEVEAAAASSDPPLDQELVSKSNEPEFQTALDKKQEAQKDAEQRPGEFRQGEDAVLAGARQEAVGGVAQQTGAMHDVRSGEFSSIVDQQQNTQSEDKQKRGEVALHVEEIYKGTQQKVEDRLKQLDTDVNTAFDGGAEDARKQFEAFVDDHMRAYKDERYDGATGAALWIKDKLLGVPDEVNVFYTQGRELYVQLMDGVIDNVAGIVETGLMDAVAIIEQGRQDVKKYVDGLPQELQEVGQQEADKIQQKFDKLAQSVEDKKNQLVDSLAQKYAANLKAIDARIDEMKAANRGLVDAALDAVKGVIDTIIGLKNMLLGVLAKAQDVIGKILKDPIGFLGNLVSAVKLGLSNFVTNIGTHLKKGLMSWLFGALASAGIEMPESFDLKGILSLILQVLGLTYANIRSRAVAIVGEPVVKALETGAEIFKILITEGPAGLWNYIKDQLSNLKDVVMDGIKSFIIERVIIAGITWLIGLLNPASAFVKACKAIYDVVMFFVTRGAQIMTLVNSILDSMAAIASGAIGGAAAAVENALANAIPVVIGFLAGLLGLGDPGEKIREILGKVRDPINKAIDWVINKAVKLVKAVGSLFGGKKKDEKQEETNDPEHDAKVTAGLAAINTEQQQKSKEGRISFKSAQEVAATVKSHHPVFKSLTVVDGGKTWKYHYVGSEGDAEGEPKEVELAGMKFVLFRGPGAAVTVTLPEQETEVVIKDVASKLAKLTALVTNLDIDENVAQALINRLPGSLDGLLAWFAREKGDDTPEEFAVKQLREQRATSAAVGSLPGREARSKLVHLGEDKEPLSRIALVGRQSIGKFESRHNPEANMTEYIFHGVGRPDVFAYGVIEVDDNGTVVRIIEVSPRVKGGRARLIELMQQAGWKTAPGLS